MLYNEKIEIKVGGRNITDLRNKNYICNIGDTIIIDIKDLSLNSHNKVLVKCDVCDNKKKISYQRYNLNLKKDGYYACSNKCAMQKYKNSINKIYGVDNPFKCEEIKNKINKIFIEKYGCSNYMKTKDFAEKSRETNLIKYGVEKSGKSNHTKSKRKNNNLIKYNVSNTSMLADVKEKIKINNLKKYGVEHVLQNEEVIKKSKYTRIKNGLQLPDISKTDFQKYHREVFNLTRKNKQTLFENWNGYDYYDNEYIKENIKLNHHNSIFPTIDHKISVYYGFKNNIPASEIADIKNLCITKQSINSRKSRLTEIQFINDVI